MLSLLRITSQKTKWNIAGSMIATIFQVFLNLVFTLIVSSFIMLLSTDSANIGEIVILRLGFVLTIGDITTGAVTHTEAIWIIVGILIGVLILNILLAVLSAFLAVNASSGATRELRNITFKRIQTMPLQDLERISVGSLMTRITQDIYTIGMVLQMWARTLIMAPITIILSIALAFAQDPQKAWIIVILIPAIFIFMAFIAWMVIPKIRTRQKQTDEINKESRENILGIRVIKSYNLEKIQLEKYRAVTNKWRELTINIGTKFSLIIPVIFTVVNLLTVGIMIVTVQMGGFTSADPAFLQTIMIFIDFMVIISMTILQLSFVILMSFRGQISAKRVLEVINNKDTFTENHNDIFINNPEIEFKNIAFGFIKEDKPIIQNVSFNVPAYSTLGIIGASGSGKSVLANLLVRNYVPDSGLITIDGKDLNQIDSDNLKDNVSITYQDAILNSGTIRENLLFAKPNASQEEIDRACITARAKQFIDTLDDSYEHKIEQRAKNLSGGQKQRISIARSLLKDSKILILDDSTSALDALTEKKVKNNIKDNYKRTTIIISQKVSAIRDCDSIILLDKGEIVAQGTHTQLNETCEMYSQIVKDQGGL